MTQTDAEMLARLSEKTLGEHHLKIEEIAAEMFDKWFYQGSKYPTPIGTIEHRFIALASLYLGQVEVAAYRAGRIAQAEEDAQATAPKSVSLPKVTILDKETIR